MKKLTAKEFLESKDINIEATQLLTFKNGHLVIVDLCDLMEEYNKEKNTEDLKRRMRVAANLIDIDIK